MSRSSGEQEGMDGDTPRGETPRATLYIRYMEVMPCVAVLTQHFSLCLSTICFQTLHVGGSLHAFILVGSRAIPLEWAEVTGGKRPCNEGENGSGSPGRLFLKGQG